VSESPLLPKSEDGLQFITAESTDASSASQSSTQTCALCRQPIHDSYYALGDKMLCAVCRERVVAVPTGSKVGRFFKALFLGLAAGLAGAIVWFVIRRVTGYEVGLVAVVLGIAVGLAVNRGSGNRGGLGYQIMAVLLTYCCIAANYMPDIFEVNLNAALEHQKEQAAKDAADPAKANAPQDVKPKMSTSEAIGALVMLFAIIFAFALALPFQLGAQNIIGLLIIGFALWEAWKFSAHKPLPISGPYQIGPQPAT
jgi:hypothetical protein